MSDAKRIVIQRYYDLHGHLREDELLRTLLKHIALYFRGMVIMPNLKKVLRDRRDVMRYCGEILRQLKELGVQGTFWPIMTMYMTRETTPSMVSEAIDCGIKLFKFYPFGGTTHSQHGILDYEETYPCVEMIARNQSRGARGLYHCEMPDPYNRISIMDREKVFIDQVLSPMIVRFPEYSWTFEHLSSKDGRDFVLSCNRNAAATISVIHMWYTYNDQYGQSANVCMPCAKNFSDRAALRERQVFVDGRFGPGNDSAPHLAEMKRDPHKCPYGVFCPGQVSIPALVQVMEEEGCLDVLPNFLFTLATATYGLQVDGDRALTLVKEPWTVPLEYDGVIPFLAGRQLQWKIASC